MLDYANGGTFAKSVVDALEVMEKLEKSSDYKQIAKEKRNVLDENKFENTLLIVAKFSKKGVEFFKANKKPSVVEGYFLTSIERENEQFAVTENLEREM